MRALLFGVIAVALAACGQPATTATDTPAATPAAPTVTGAFVPATSLAALNGARVTASANNAELTTPTANGQWAASLTAAGAKTDGSTHYRVTLQVNTGSLMLISSYEGAPADHIGDQATAGAGAPTTVTLRVDNGGAGAPTLYFINTNQEGRSTATITGLEMITQP